MPFSSGPDYLKLPRCPDVWLIEDLLPVSGAMNLYSKAKSGKALALDTPILTPTGWRTIGDLADGDLVYAADGTPTKILSVSETFTHHPCYRVTFTNNDSIVADAEHNWIVTSSRKYPATPEIKTTQELVNSQVKYRHKRYQWHVPTPNALELPEQPLPIDPYLLGTWLGDGTSANGTVTIADKEIIDHWKTKFEVHKMKDNPYGYSIYNLRVPLRNIGLLNNKHIPEIYLSSSINQRLELLKGLLDTDGSWERGAAIFYNTNELLANQTYSLAASLGFRVSIRKKKSTLYGVEHKPCYCVRIRPHVCPFKLSRKANQWTLNNERYYAIKSIVPVPSVPTRCLYVEHPSHTYVVGKSCVVTHNTYLALQFALAIANHEPEVLGFKVRSYGPVAFLQIDTPRGLFATKYLERIATTHDISKIFVADTLTTPYPFNILGEGGIWLREELAKLNPSPVLLIIDTLRELHSGDENDSGVLRNVMVAISAATRSVSPPPALMLLSHSRKSNPNAPDDPGDLMSGNRGSNYISGRMDSILQIVPKKKSNEGYLNFQSRSIEEGSLKMIRDDLGLWRRKVDDDLAYTQSMVNLYPTLSHNALAKKLVVESGKGSISTWTRRLQEVLHPHDSTLGG